MIHHFVIEYLFRYKQRGKEAVAANNIFPHVTYDGMVDIDKITDPVSIMHFAFSDLVKLYKIFIFFENAEGATARCTKSNMLFWTDTISTADSSTHKKKAVNRNITIAGKKFQVSFPCFARKEVHYLVDILVHILLLYQIDMKKWIV